MVEQWFLDLDGVRSGPYQTSEVMGLIADGEVFPHHRISISLKDSPWQTILEWRLEQARQVQSKRTSPQNAQAAPQARVAPPVPIASTAPAPAASAPKVEKANEFENDSKTLRLERVKTQEEALEEAQKKASNPPSPEDDSLPPPIPTFSAGQDDFLREVASLEKTRAESYEPGSGKRDPMAEMFDILQSTRQKREARQLLSAQLASEEEKLSQKKPFSVKKLGILVVSVTIIGFFIGQLGQLIFPPAPPVAKDAKPKEDAAPKSPVKTEVLDRSNDKMTIRAVVEKKPEPTPTKPVVVRTRTPAPTVAPPPASESSDPRDAQDGSRREKKVADKDLEELRDLKKELQELKALKEELKNAPLNDDFSDGDLGPYPDNSGRSFGGSSGGYGGANGTSPSPNPGPDGMEYPANSGRPKGTPPQEEYRY
jgi:hypothetical protein